MGVANTRITGISGLGLPRPTEQDPTPSAKLWLQNAGILLLTKIHASCT